MTGCLVQVALLALLACRSICQSKDGYTDENRPYEFGFTIDGEQHRHEKKDEKGIIMGEFGFITADGIYHVTVYATDENGDFKIIEMRNIKVGFPPGKGTTTTPKPAQKQVQLNGLMGCSGCRIPETASRPGVPGGYPSSGASPVQTGKGVPPSGHPDKSPTYGTAPKDRFGASGKDNAPPSVQINLADGKEKFKGQQYPKTPVPGGTYPSTGIQTPPSVQQNLAGGKEKFKGQQYPKTPVQGGTHPSTASPNVGQPQLTGTEMKILDYMARLYKFNYTLTFHGHEETGDTGGNKNGSYFTNGRDGYQRKVIYVANEFGYQPKITLIKLDAASTPNEQTEKELNKLKGSEFIWFYKRK